MPSIEANVEEWGGKYHWAGAGEDWSSPWGGTSFLWRGTILPRIYDLVPAAHILEIAPGFGRISQYLLPLCQKLTLVDLNERCIDACRARFSNFDHVSYHVNDGRSLALVPDRSVDLAFSFDSLVHADSDVIESYLRQLAVKLKPDGVGFFHHSNIGAYVVPIERWLRWWPAKRTVKYLKWRINRNWRSEDMTADKFRALCAVSGLYCKSQETVNWLSRLQNDCFSTFVRSQHSPHMPHRIRRHSRFGLEAELLRQLAEVYRT